jgi:5'-methylthioadenosine phosphorylase
MVTDYDVWHPSHGSVTVEMVIQNLMKNAEMAKRIVRYAAGEIPGERDHCPCPNALRDSIITSRDHIPAKARQDLGLILDKYLPNKKTARPIKRGKK